MEHFVVSVVGQVIAAFLAGAVGLLIPKAHAQAGDSLQEVPRESVPDKNTEGLSAAEWRWDFDRWGDLEGWTVPKSMRGAVSGGALWLTMQGDPDRTQWEYHAQMFLKATLSAPVPSEDIASPRGLAIPASRVKKIRMRILNLSPETDLFFVWRRADRPDEDVWIDNKSSIWGTVHLSMKPYHREWQEVVCHVDGLWSGVIDQIRFRPVMRLKGDIWIDWIAITDGEPRPTSPRPDVASEKVVPRVSLPGISQGDFRDAFRVLDECLYTDVPLYGFGYPFMGPGGSYGECWWQFDTSLNVAGAKWANQAFVEGIIRGFLGVQAQNPDGRIDLFGMSVVRGQPGDVSAMPWYFEAAYDVARRTGDEEFREDIYESMKRYLGWWLSPVKRDGATGLVTCTAEETHGEPQIELPASMAPVDLNVLVALGCHNVSVLAEHLDRPEEAARYREVYAQLVEGINRYMWSESEGAYFNYNLVKKEPSVRLLSTTFNPMRLGMAPPERVARLIPKLLAPGLFNWGKLPLTSLAKTEADYGEATGSYTSGPRNPWFGSVWTMRNRSVIAGLQDAGRHDLAAELAWSTIKAFNANYCEWLVPSTGVGQGVERYGFSASQYIQAVIEHLFGIDYDRMRNRLQILPHVPKELVGKQLSITDLILPTGGDTRLSLAVEQTAQGEGCIAVEIAGYLPEGELDVFVPEAESGMLRMLDEDGDPLPPIEGRVELENVNGVRLALKPKTVVRLVCPASSREVNRE